MKRLLSEGEVHLDPQIGRVSCQWKKSPLPSILVVWPLRGTGGGAWRSFIRAAGDWPMWHHPMFEKTVFTRHWYLPDLLVRSCHCII